MSMQLAYPYDHTVTGAKFGNEDTWINSDPLIAKSGIGNRPLGLSNGSKIQKTLIKGQRRPIRARPYSYDKSKSDQIGELSIPPWSHPPSDMPPGILWLTSSDPLIAKSGIGNRPLGLSNGSKIQKTLTIFLRQIQVGSNWRIEHSPVITSSVRYASRPCKSVINIVWSIDCEEWDWQSALGTQQW
jgi:hypothetical protein